MSIVRQRFLFNATKVTNGMLNLIMLNKEIGAQYATSVKVKKQSRTSLSTMTFPLMNNILYRSYQGRNMTFMFITITSIIPWNTAVYNTSNM